MNEEEAKKGIEDLQQLQVLIGRIPPKVIAPALTKGFMLLLEESQNKCYQALGKIYYKELG